MHLSVVLVKQRFYCRAANHVHLKARLDQPESFGILFLNFDLEEFKVQRRLLPKSI
jgi:hypothetical protein